MGWGEVRGEARRGAVVHGGVARSVTLTLHRTAMDEASNVPTFPPPCSEAGGRVQGRHLSEYCATIFHSKRSTRNALKISSIMSAGAREDCTPRCHRR